MEKRGIAILGLGPGDPELITRQVWRVLEEGAEIYLRTFHHPVIEQFPKHLRVFSFDELYEKCEAFTDVYCAIVDRILELGCRPEGVIYAVPGHPFVAEATSPEIIRRAHSSGIPVKVYEGLSFLEPVFTALKLDPLPHTTIVDALELVGAHVPIFPPSADAIIAQIHSREVAADVKLTLMAHYPDELPVKLIHAAGTTQEIVEEMPLHRVDRSLNIGLLTVLFVPSLGPESSFEAFQEIVAHLRAPDGCPWDREQTHQSLRTHLVEETYEVLASIDKGDYESMQEEFGDLLLQIVLHAQIASETGEFTMVDVLRSIHSKIVYRHPHVFGDLELKGAEDVLLNWERMKAEERARDGKADESLLGGVSLALPALIRAEQYQQRAARVGFDWPEFKGVMEKIEEEIQEMKTAQEGVHQEKEIGDLLFSIVNLARWCNIDPESALHGANTRFRNRFNFIEDAAYSRGTTIADLSLEEMERFWQEAKKHSM